MSKKDIEAVAEELEIFENYETGDGTYPEFVYRLLASIPGGEDAEDRGYEPFIEDGFGWDEVTQLNNILNALQTNRDTELLVTLLFKNDEDEDDV